MNPFVLLLVQVIELYWWIVIVWAIVSTLVAFKVVNQHQPVVYKVMYALNRLCEPVMKPIRKALPDLGGVDLSPVIVLLLLNFAQNFLIRYLG